MGKKPEPSIPPTAESATAKDAMLYVEKYLKLADQALAQKRRSKKATAAKPANSAKAAKAGS